MIVISYEYKSSTKFKKNVIRIHKHYFNTFSKIKKNVNNFFPYSDKAVLKINYYRKWRDKSSRTERHLDMLFKLWENQDKMILPCF